MRRRAALALCAAVTLAGCGAAPAPGPLVTPTHTAPGNVPADSVLLTAVGFRNAPKDFMIPATATITQRVDQTNTVTAVFTAPSGVEFAGYLRRTLPGQGWTITADGNNSLLFERDGVRGAFTAGGQTSALAIRYDEQS